MVARIQGKFGAWWNSIWGRLSRQFLLMKFLLSRLQRDVRIWVSTVFVLISLKTEIARSVNGPKLQELRAEDAKDHKVLSDNCESRNNHRYAVVVQDFATQWIQAYPCKNKTSQETQRKLAQVPETREETKSHLHWQFLRIRKSLWRSFMESLHVYTTPIRD